MRGRSPAPAPAGGAAGGRGGAALRAGGPLPAPTDIKPRTEYPRPWLGGHWTLRDIVDYEMIATMALLDAAADRRETLLRQIYEVNRQTIEDGEEGRRPAAILIPVAGQHDPDEASSSWISCGSAGWRCTGRRGFRAGREEVCGRDVRGAVEQVFARYAKDLLEKQTYPEVRRSPGAPAEAPYDVSAWSLGMQFGVKTEFAKSSLPEGLVLQRVMEPPKYDWRRRMAGGSWRFPYSGAMSAMVVNRLLKGGASVGRRRRLRRYARTRARRTCGARR